MKTAVMNYLRAGDLANGTRQEYLATLRKWTEWGGDVPIEELSRHTCASSIGFMSRLLKNHRRILAEQRTSVVRISVPSCHGRGNGILLSSFLDSLSQDRIDALPVDMN